jgi:hypothetical protein
MPLISSNSWDLGLQIYMNGIENLQRLLMLVAPYMNIFDIVVQGERENY